MLDSTKYGEQLNELLGCDKNPLELLQKCIQWENRVNKAAGRWCDSRITEKQFDDIVTGVASDMKKYGIDITVLDFDSDPRGICIKVRKEDWPYTDFGGVPVLVHGDFL